MKSGLKIKAKQKRKIAGQAIKKKKPVESDLDLAFQLKEKYPALFDNNIDSVRRFIALLRMESQIPASSMVTKKEKAVSLAKEILSKYPGEKVGVLALRLQLKTGYSLHYNRKIISNISKFNKMIW